MSNDRRSDRPQRRSAILAAIDGFCDAVAMFKDGEMIEYGTHQSLLNAGGAYADMFRVQAQYYVEGGAENGEENEGFQPA